MIKNKELIISRTPLRISFFGGGTDMPYFYKKQFGQTISSALNKYVYVIIKTHNSYDEKFRINYSKTENVNQLKKMKNRRVKAVLQHFKINMPLYISTISDLPANTGLGSSSSFTVGLINAIAFLIKKKINKKEIAELAFNIENSLLREDLGKQDQFISSLGGVKHLIYKKNKVEEKKINNVNKKIENLFQNSLVIFTNQKRESKLVLNKQKKKFKKNYNNLIKMRENVNKFSNLLKSNQIKKIGELMNKSWELKKKLSNKISNRKIDTLYKNLLKEGCYGGKLLGAGNGGFLFMIMNKKTKNVIKKKFKNYKFFEPNIDIDGTIIL